MLYTFANAFEGDSASIESGNGYAILYRAGLHLKVQVYGKMASDDLVDAFVILHEARTAVLINA